MSDKNKLLTKEEVIKLIKQYKKHYLKNYSTNGCDIVKIGFLKHHIYDSGHYGLPDDLYLISQEERDQLVDNYKNSFYVLAPKNTLCIYTVDYDGGCMWEAVRPQPFSVLIEENSSDLIEPHMHMIQDVTGIFDTLVVPTE